MKKRTQTKKLKQTGFIDSSIELYKPIKLIRKMFGYTAISYGVVTLWCPISASIVAIAGGCLLVGIEYKELMKSINFYAKNLYNWLYCNRTPKKLKHTIKQRLLSL